MRYLRGLTRVSKRININIRLKDLRVTVCPTGREIESSPFAVLSKDSAGLHSTNAGVSCPNTGRRPATSNRFNAILLSLNNILDENCLSCRDSKNLTPESREIPDSIPG